MAHLAFMLALLLLSVLSEPQAHLWYDALLAESGYGRLSQERAAFLIREDDGTLTLEPWARGGFRHASWRGAIPQRTIAILHTHPAGEEQPSARDRKEAQRLGMPVIVITPEAVMAAMPDGTVSAVRTRGRVSETRRDPSARHTSPHR